MSRASLPVLLLLCVCGCQVPSERQAVRPLPDDSPPLPYAELLTRARAQAKSATEAYYIDRWADLEDAARGLEQTARFLGKTYEVPARVRDRLEVKARDLGKEATALREAARAKDADKVKESLQRVHDQVRDLRLDD